MLEMNCTTTNIFFNQQKTESGDALYIFLSFLLFIFFCSSCFFCLHASTKEYKHIHLIFSFHLLFLLSISFFCFLNRTGMVLYVLYWDLMVSWLHLMFQVFKCLKWRVQPQTSFLTSKNRVWQCFIYFSELSSVHLLLFIMFLLFSDFNLRVQTHAFEIFRSSYVSFVDIFFCLLSQANRYVSLCFVMSCKWLLASS